MTFAALQDVLDDAAAELSPAELPDLIGLLEATKARALLRLQQPPTVPPRLVDASEMAAILGTPENWVRDKARAGALPFHQLGHYVRFSPPDVLEAVRRMSAVHDSRFRSVPKAKEKRGGRRPVSTECPSSIAETAPEPARG